MQYDILYCTLEPKKLSRKNWKNLKKRNLQFIVLYQRYLLNFDNCTMVILNVHISETGCRI